MASFLVMQSITRRRFISASSVLATACAADLSFLAPLSRAAASDTTIKPDEVIFGPETDRLLRLIRTTSREQCVPAFAREVKAGLSYQQFLTVLFLAAVENGDPHQVAQVYGAHRISSDARIEERLLPLFWVLNRVKQESEAGAAPNPALKPFHGKLPGADQAGSLFRDALLRSDAAEAERAALALARDHGARHVMARLWEFAPRNIGGNLGHPAIALANSQRALEAMGWQHSEVALRYVTRYIAGYKGDKTYSPNLERVKQTLSHLPGNWTSAESSRAATIELYKLLRAGNADESCDLICSQLRSNKAKAGAAWDAISLAAADSVFRHRIGGGMLGAQIHAVTTTNALRYGFNLVDHPQTKLVNLLQGAGVICDFYVRHVSKEGNLREMSLLDLKQSPRKTTGTMRDVFEMLPFKGKDYFKEIADERAASDEACRMAFDLLSNAGNHAAFMQTARSFLCVKASLDPHDIKYPAAVFEDAASVSAEWRPYLLASSVHALHGTKSSDTAVLVQVRDALN
jgi:hypothetical protein